MKRTNLYSLDGSGLPGGLKTNDDALADPLHVLRHLAHVLHLRRTNLTLTVTFFSAYYNRQFESDQITKENIS